MPKTLLLVTFFALSLFAYSVQLDKPSHTTIQKKEKHEHLLIRDDKKELIIDKTTGLMWQDDSDTKTIKKNQQDAKQYCRSLVFAGYDDWYLPRVKELESILDPKRSAPTIQKAFKNVISGHYWTSSPNLSDIVNAINVDFGSANAYQSNRRGRAYVRCCRGHSNSLI